MATSWQNIKWTLTALQLQATRMLMGFCIRIRWNAFVLNTNKFHFHHIWYKETCQLPFPSYFATIYFFFLKGMWTVLSSDFVTQNSVSFSVSVRYVVNQITTFLTCPPFAVNSAVQCRKVWYELFTLGQRGTSGGLSLKCHSDTNLYIHTMLRGAGASQ